MVVVVASAAENLVVDVEVVMGEAAFWRAKMR
jgi:hypothetical protein